MTTSTTTRLQPAKRFRFGDITISVWPQQDRAGRRFYNTTITRRARTASGLWRHDAEIRPCDLPSVRSLSAEANEWIASHPLPPKRDVAARASDGSIEALCALIEQQFSR